MSQQLPLALQLNSPASLDDFIDADQGELLHQLAEQAAGHQALIYLHGPSASGKSHLLLGQCAALQASGQQIAYLPCREHAELHPAMLDNLETLDLIAIDDVDAIAGQADWEQALFHLFNRARESGTRLLFSAQGPSMESAIALPDLRSRLAWGLNLGIRPLDDAGRQQLIRQLASKRGLDMPEAVARYLVERQARGHAELLALIDKLDKASLREQRRLSIPFVREQLSQPS